MKQQAWQTAGVSALIEILATICGLGVAQPLLASPVVSPSFPLKVSENRRYLVDQQGKPFFVMGDTPWFVQKLEIEEVRMLMDDRLAKGFNTLFLELLDDSRIPSQDGYGNVAFQPDTDITKPVEAPNLFKLMQPLAWWELVPDAKHAFVTSGFGEWKQADYATAALAADGSCGAVYVPSARTLSVDLSKLNAAASAAWFDPSCAALKPVDGSPFENQGERAFNPPGRNTAGDSDWVLVLQTETSRKAQRSR